MCSECILCRRHTQDQRVSTSTNCCWRIYCRARRTGEICRQTWIQSSPKWSLRRLFVCCPLHTHTHKITSRLVSSLVMKSSHFHTRKRKQLLSTSGSDGMQAERKKKILFFTVSHRQSTISSVSLWFPLLFVFTPAHFESVSGWSGLTFKAVIFPSSDYQNNTVQIQQTNILTSDTEMNET